MKIYQRVQSIMSLKINLKPTLHIAALGAQKQCRDATLPICVNLGEQKASLKYWHLHLK